MDILSSRFKQKTEKKEKAKEERVDSGNKKKQELEEMMQKTVRKSKKDSSSKSYVVTEGGIVENDETEFDPTNVPKRKEPKSLLQSMSDVEKAKKKLAENSEAQTTKPILAKTSELDRRRSSITIASLAEAKNSFGSLLRKRRSSTLSGDLGLEEVGARANRAKMFGAIMLVGKAITLMSAPRIKRKGQDPLRLNRKVAMKFKSLNKNRGADNPMSLSSIVYGLGKVSVTRFDRMSFTRQILIRQIQIQHERSF